MTPKCLRPMNRTNEHAQDVPLFRPIWKRDNNEIVAFFGCLSFWENLTKVPAGPGIKCSDKNSGSLFSLRSAKLKFSERLFLIRVSFQQRSRSTAANGRCRVADILFFFIRPEFKCPSHLRVVSHERRESETVGHRPTRRNGAVGTNWTSAFTSPLSLTGWHLSRRRVKLVAHTKMNENV